MCMNPLHFLQSKFLHDEEKIMKSISKPTFKNITRYKDYSQIEYIKKKIEYDSAVYVGVTILELSKLHMYDVFYNILQPSLKDLQLHYMDTDSFKSYPHENLYLFKRDLVNKINNTTLELLIKLGLDVSKESLESLINNILELTINDDRMLIEAAIKLYNDL